MDQSEVTRPIAEEGDSSLRTLVQQVIGEYLELQKRQTEPAQRTELAEERKRRESLERRVNELVEENRRAKVRAEEAERTAAIRSELQRLGVTKPDLAYRAIKDDISRSEDGRLVARDGQQEVDFKEYLAKFLQENPELLPPRISGGSGASLGNRGTGGPPSLFDLDRIKPGMDPRELEQIRREIARLASPNGPNY